MYGRYQWPFVEVGNSSKQEIAAEEPTVTQTAATPVITKTEEPAATRTPTIYAIDPRDKYLLSKDWSHNGKPIDPAYVPDLLLRKVFEKAYGVEITRQLFDGPNQSSSKENIKNTNIVVNAQTSTEYLLKDVRREKPMQTKRPPTLRREKGSKQEETKPVEISVETKSVKPQEEQKVVPVSPRENAPDTKKEQMLRRLSLGGNQLGNLVQGMGDLRGTLRKTGPSEKH